jgi:hypothetical protein
MEELLQLGVKGESETICYQYTVVVDGNKSLYLVFVGVIFSQHLGLLLEQLGQQHLGCFF